MKTSKDRILTTHTGSLPRPKPLIDLVMNRERGEMIDAAAFADETAKAIDDIVAIGLPRQSVTATLDALIDWSKEPDSAVWFGMSWAEAVRPV